MIRRVSLNIIKVIPTIFFAGILCSCENDIEEVNALSSKKNEPIRRGKNVELIHSEKAQIKMRLTAPLMEEYDGEKNYTEMPLGIQVNLYDSLQNVSTKLTANYAIHKTSENIMEAKNDVVVINEKGDKLNTEHLIWLQDSSKIYTNEFVKITTKDEIIMGEGLQSNEDFTKYKILKIKGTIQLKDEEGVNNK
ncbi:MAG: LPS export ABC transporter periplasmic protein LptC [Flavobacteriales bacterium]|nr:MAG: LPS export ABC transporter periplasmic protein LptC [Flavobacteriales bacterium]